MGAPDQGINTDLQGSHRHGRIVEFESAVKRIFRYIQSVTSRLHSRKRLNSLINVVRHASEFSIGHVRGSRRHLEPIGVCSFCPSRSDASDVTALALRVGSNTVLGSSSSQWFLQIDSEVIHASARRAT
jgi:hypothetical protein